MKKSLIHSLAKSLALAAILSVVSLTPAAAAEDAPTPPEMDWPHHGIFGTYDKSALQRGFQVYREVCAACHGMDQLAYRNLADIGYNEDEVKAIASDYYVEDGPNDEGEMFERQAGPADTFKNPYANESAARYANNGALPPDLSLIVKARGGGEDYIYGLLTGYTEAPEGETLLAGQYWNEYMAGHKISMPPPIYDGAIIYSDGTEATVEQASHDVTQFLAWASEPHMDTRKAMGFKVILYLLAFTILMWFAKKKLWRDIKK
ncbi:MAG: cytochrome c1 [Pseudomonadota bacterium]